MAGMDFGFNPATVQPQWGGGGYDYPAGKYPAVIKSATPEPIGGENSGKGGKLVIEFEFLDGPPEVKGKTFKENLNLWHSQSQKTVEIARQQLSALAHAIGRASATNSDQLVGGTCIVEIRRDDKPGAQYRNSIGGVEPMGGQVQQSSVQTQPPAQQQPGGWGGGQVQGGQAQPQTAQGGGWGQQGGQQQPSTDKPSWAS